MIFPGTGDAASALGYAIFGATVDEANSMKLTAATKRLHHRYIYDAAAEARREIKNRMDSRFQFDHLRAQNKETGILSMISQVRHTSDYLRRLIREAKILGDKSDIFYVEELSRWDAQPKERFPKEKFLFDVQRLKIIHEYKMSATCEVCLRDVRKILLYPAGETDVSKGTIVCSESCYKELHNREFDKSTELEKV